MLYGEWSALVATSIRTVSATYTHSSQMTAASARMSGFRGRQKDGSAMSSMSSRRPARGSAPCRGGSSGHRRAARAVSERATMATSGQERPASSSAMGWRLTPETAAGPRRLRRRSARVAGWPGRRQRRLAWCQACGSSIRSLGAGERWAHMLGYRSHFSTESRRYSTTLGALREVLLSSPGSAQAWRRPLATCGTLPLR
ncbi:replication initiator [Nonomuraea sp. CA-141351]|uniref:replication initiator n=1 Tax=Nonomuraea sp. CA-141351 TaxID=3239996 RepID=UPI003D8A02D0